MNQKLHPHANLIAEAILNTDRGISKVRPSGAFETVCLTHVVDDLLGKETFFFDDTPPTIQQECVSPLTDEELQDAVDGYSSSTGIRRAIANAAHREALRWVARLPAVTSLGHDELSRLWLLGDNAEDGNVAIANAAIADFQSSLKTMLGQ